LLLAAAEPGQREWRTQVLGRELLDLAREDLVHGLDVFLGATDWGHCAFVEVCGEAGDTGEQLQNLPDAVEVFL